MNKCFLFYSILFYSILKCTIGNWGFWPYVSYIVSYKEKGLYPAVDYNDKFFNLNESDNRDKNI